MHQVFWVNEDLPLSRYLSGCSHGQHELFASLNQPRSLNLAGEPRGWSRAGLPHPVAP